MTRYNTKILIFTSTLLAVAAPSTAGANPLLEQVSIAEGSAAFVDVDGVGGPRALDGAMTKMQACTKAVDAALQGGLAPTVETKVYDSKSYPRGRRVKKPGYTASHYAPIQDIRTGCVAKFGKLRVLPVRWGIEDVLAHTAALRQRTKPDIHSSVPAQLAYDKCVTQVRRSLKLGAPPETMVVAKNLQLRLDEAEAKGCGTALPVIAEAKQKAHGAKDAKFAPYRKALRGDKWKTFKNKNMLHFRVRGPGGRQLSTPRAFAAASVWFEPLRSGSYRRWAMRRYKFDRKNRLVSSRRITGSGRTPPSRAYR